MIQWEKAPVIYLCCSTIDIVAETLNLYLPTPAITNKKFQLNKDTCILLIHFMHNWILPSVTYSRLSRLCCIADPLCSLTIIPGYGQIDQTENVRFHTYAYIWHQPVQTVSQASPLLKCDSSWSLLHLLPRSTQLVLLRGILAKGLARKRHFVVFLFIFFLLCHRTYGWL